LPKRTKKKKPKKYHEGGQKNRKQGEEFLNMMASMEGPAHLDPPGPTRTSRSGARKLDRRGKTGTEGQHVTGKMGAENIKVTGVLSQTTM